MDTNMEADPLEALPLRPPLPLPEQFTQQDIIALFESFELVGSPSAELAVYWGEDWRRFVYTLGLVRDLRGSCLELGANPYFTTVLLKYFTHLDLTLANYFWEGFGPDTTQYVRVRSPLNGAPEEHAMQFAHFNIEDASFPYETASFDVVLLCEVIEHLQLDPLGVILEIKRVLKPSGHLVITTPNVSRLENVCRMVAGVNIYDPYSGYGAYGRHNREYNKHELAGLLEFAGFEPEVLVSADVHENRSPNYTSVDPVIPLVAHRPYDLGQYLFCRARNSRLTQPGRPSWLYRSYHSGELG